MTARVAAPTLREMSETRRRLGSRPATRRGFPSNRAKARSSPRRRSCTRRPGGASMGGSGRGHHGVHLHVDRGFTVLANISSSFEGPALAARMVMRRTGLAAPKLQDARVGHSQVRSRRSRRASRRASLASPRRVSSSPTFSVTFGRTATSLSPRCPIWPVERCETVGQVGRLAVGLWSARPRRRGLLGPGATESSLRNSVDAGLRASLPDPSVGVKVDI